MKSLLFFLLWGSMTALLAQEQLFLKDGQIIDPIQLHEIKSVSVVYAKDGSLHEILKSDILFVKNDRLTLSFSVKGQVIKTYRSGDHHKSSRTKPLLTPRKGTIFVVPTSPISLSPSILAGIEFPLGSRWSLVQEAGVVLRSIHLGGKVTNSWQSQTSFRHYLKTPFGLFGSPGRRYLEGEFVYQNLSLSSTSNSSTENAIGELVELTYYRDRSVKVFGGNVQAGVQWVFFNRLMLEIWAGLGIQDILKREYSRSVQVTFLDGVVIDRDEEEIDYREVQRWPAVSGGVKLGIAL